MNHKKSRVLAAAISSLLSFGMILQTAAPPRRFMRQKEYEGKAVRKRLTGHLKQQTIMIKQR